MWLIIIIIIIIVDVGVFFLLSILDYYYTDRTVGLQGDFTFFNLLP